MHKRNLFKKIEREISIEEILIKSKHFNDININFNQKRQNDIKILFNQEYAEIFWEKFCKMENRLKAELTVFIAKSIDNLDANHPLKNKQEKWLEFLEYIVDPEVNGYIDVFTHHLKQTIIQNKLSTSYIWEDIICLNWTNLFDIFMFILKSDKVDLKTKIQLVRKIEPKFVKNNLVVSEIFVNKIVDYFNFLNKLRKAIINNYSILDFFTSEKL